MVWKPKKSRRSGSRSTIPSNRNGAGNRQLRSCLKVRPDNNVLVGEAGRAAVRGGQESNSTRDHSNKSGRSILSARSGSASSRSRDTTSSDNHIHSVGSGASGESHLSHRDSTGRSSQHSPVAYSGGSTGRSSQHSPVAYSGGSTAEDKVVRFGSISIREHERIVGDNPSCSTGPPIGIGWGYGDTRVMPLDDYEERKSYRRRPIVLTRSEREEILLNWGISFDDIIDSIRMNIRVKNQRRQTVTNLGKIEKLEEAFESATRKIKRALLLRRRTGEKVKRLQEQAEVAKKVHSPSSSVEEELKADQIYREDSQANGEAGEEERRNQISLPDFRKKGPPEMKLARSTSSLSDVDELHTSISGFSLGNSTTASAREMERFYRELEMEMFGDMPLPDMVGETLEVPGLTIPEEERVYHDPPFSLSHQEPPSVAPSYAAMLDESKEYQEVDPPPRASQLLHRPEMKLYFQPNPPPWFQTDSDMRGRGNDPALNHALEDGADGHIAPIRHIVSPQRDKEAEVLSAQMPTPPAGLIFYDDPIMAIRMGHVPPPHVRLRSSLDSVDMEKLEQHRSNMARAYLSQTVTAMEQRYLHPSLAPPVPPTNQFGMAYYPEENTRGFHPGGGLPSVVEQDENSSATSSTGRSKRSKRRKDGPEIRHTPPFLRKSPTHWMEGHDEAEDGPGMYSPYCDPITISEDEASEDRIRPSYQRPLEPQPVFIAPQHFLDTYYG